jgi:hypothetical protein
MPTWLLEAVRGENDPKDKAPMAWRVRMIRAGTSKNGNEYTPQVLAEAAPLFEGARCLIRTEAEHIADTNRSAKTIGGWWSDVKADSEGLTGTLNILAAEAWFADKIWEAWQRGKRDLIQFSIVAEATGFLRRVGGRAIRSVRKILNVKSVDAVVDASAGGEILGLAEAITTFEREESQMDREKLLKLLEAKAPDTFKRIDPEKISDDELLEVLAEALQGSNTEDDETTKVAEGGEKPAAATLDREALRAIVAETLKPLQDDLLSQLAEQRFEASFQKAFAESKLPQDARASVRRRIDAAKGDDWGEAKFDGTIAEAIKGEREYLGKLAGFRGPGSHAAAGQVQPGLDELDRWNAALYGLLIGEAVEVESGGKKHRVAPYRSIRDCYVDLTGDTEVTGRLSECDRPSEAHLNLISKGMLAEATIASGTWAGLLGDNLRKAVQREYAMAPYDQWKTIADITSPVDFRTNYRPQMGGFSELASVAEAGAYQDFTTAPDDFTPSYAVTKYGNLQPVNLETIVNDDVGAVKRIPQKIGRAAARTVNTQSWYPIINNSACSWDSTALFHANHGSNLGSSALSPTTVAAGRLIMKKQTEPQSSARLNLPPKYLAVPADLEQTAVEICFTPSKPLIEPGTADSGNRENPGIVNVWNRWNLTPIVIPHATDTNNWYLFSDPKDIPIIEVGFLNGQQTPELFVQDMPSQGSLFSNDQIKYKARLIFGVCLLDYRGAYGAIVA